MSEKDKNYGTYYGELIDFDSNSERPITLSDLSLEESLELCQKLKSYGVSELKFDIEDNNDWTSTIFFETNSETNYKELMLIIAVIRPSEFSEETPNHYRLWLD